MKGCVLYSSNRESEVVRPHGNQNLAVSITNNYFKVYLKMGVGNDDFCIVILFISGKKETLNN